MSLGIEVQAPGLLGLEGHFAAMGPRLLAGLARGLRAGILVVEAEAKARVRRRSGRLASSIASEVSGEGDRMEARASTEVAYAAVLERGSRAHEIVAHGRALMLPVGPWAGGGSSRSVFGGARLSGAPRAGQQVAFFRSVHHPGTQAHPFMRPALEESVGRIEAELRREADAALDG